MLIGRGKIDPIWSEQLKLDYTSFKAMIRLFQRR